MNLYTVVLFVHSIAVLALTAALTIETWTILQLRRSARPSEVRPWLDAQQLIVIPAILSLLTIFITGAWLTQTLRLWEYAWPRLAVLDVVLFAFLGANTGRRMRILQRYVASEKINPPAWNALTQSAFLKISLSTRIWIVIGTILLTAAKPNLSVSLVIVACSLIVGLLLSFASFGRRSPGREPVETSGR